MILFISHDASLTGAPRSLLLIIEYLKLKYDEDFEIILGKTGPLESEFRSYGKVHIYHKEWLFENNLFKRIRNRLFYSNHLRQKRIKKYFTKKKPKLIFNNTIVNGEILQNLSSLKVKTISRVPEMETVMKMYDSIFNNSTQKVLSNSHFFISPSKSAKQDLIDIYSIEPQKIKVCYGQIKKFKLDKDRGLNLRKELNIPREANIIGGCGTLGWRKGSDLFLKIAQLQSKSNVYFLWLGAHKNSVGYHNFIYEAEKLKVLDKIVVVEYQLNINKYYQIMDVFLMTSREDPYPLVNLEAAACGIPIICFKDSGGSEEFVEKGYGHVVPFGSTDDMSKKIDLILSNKNKSRISKSKIEDIFRINQLEKIWLIVEEFLKKN